MFKWIPKSDKNKSPVQKIDVWKRDDVIQEGVPGNLNDQPAPGGNIIPIKPSTSPANKPVPSTNSVQSKLLISHENRLCFESSLGEPYVDTGTYF